MKRFQSVVRITPGLSGLNGTFEKSIGTADSRTQSTNRNQVMKQLTQRVICLCFLAMSFVGRAEAQENPDRVVHDGVPQGKLTSGQFNDSQVFPGTKRDYSVYVPAQYKGDEPAALMVFMDGGGYSNPKGDFGVPVVFDNLIHQKKMPVTIAVFVNPGTIAATAKGAKDRSNRSFEYDSTGDRHANFLIEEFLPVALKGLNVSSDPAKRA